MRLLLAALALTFAACAPAAPAPAQAQTGSTLEVRDTWASPTPRGVDVSAGYLTIVNRGRETDRLIAVESPRAARVEVHEMSMDGSVMRMRAVERLEIGPGARVTLGPGGLHLMFFGVTQPFAEGEDISVRLQFERAGLVEAQLRVRHGASHGH